MRHVAIEWVTATAGVQVTCRGKCRTGDVSFAIAQHLRSGDPDTAAITRLDVFSEF